MTSLLLALLLQSITVPPRYALENPAVVSPVPQKIKKDYDKLWARFLTAKDDAKLLKDLDKLLAKQKNLDAALILQAYLDLSQRKDDPAAQKLGRVIESNPTNRIALYYLAEMAFARLDYARASQLYSRLLAIDSSRTDIEPKRQKAVLLATENLLRAAERAEQQNRLADAEGLYKQALNMAPREPAFHARLGSLLAKQKKWDEALDHYRQQVELAGHNTEVDRNIAEALTNLGRVDEAREFLDRIRKEGNLDGREEARITELEDLGRWGKDIQRFQAIKTTDQITREQMAVLIVRYFPQVAEFRQSPQIVTDTQTSWAGSEIQTTVSVGLIDPLPNHTFQPGAPITRGQFATSLARLSLMLGLTPPVAPRIPLHDVDASNAAFKDIQTAIGLGLVGLDDSGNFNVDAPISGQDAVHAMERLLRRPAAKDA
jgi:tetratricopeptide (TPR) repeat protein